MIRADYRSDRFWKFLKVRFDSYSGSLLARNSVYILILSVAALVTLGLVMLFSISAYAQEAHGDIYHFVKRQAIWLAIGMTACLGAALIDYRVWSKLCWPVFVFAVILLALCFVPGIGMELNGSRRWINLGVAAFQPSELGKFSAVILLAWWFSRFEYDAGKFFKGFAFPGLIVGVICLLILWEVDLGTTALIGGTMLAVMFVAGSNPFALGTVVIAGAGGILYVATQIKERADRLMAFLDLEAHRLDAGLQQYNALIALGSGGLDGVGLGEGRQKFFYLPYAHTDFIFPMIGEELGLRMAVLVVLAYLLIFVSGILIALHARDRFGMLLGTGVTLLIALQAVVNIGVTIAVLPNKGMPLPFVSYGGSNLLFCLLFVGILVNIHRHGILDRRSRSEMFVSMAARVMHRI